MVPTFPLIVLEPPETISATCVDATNYQAFVDAVAHHLKLNYVYIKTNLPHMGNNSFSLTVPATIGKLTDLVSLQLAHVAKLPDAIKGFRFLDKPCNPCVGAAFPYNNSCPFSLKNGKVSPAWEKIWGLPPSPIEKLPRGFPYWIN